MVSWLRIYFYFGDCFNLDLQKTKFEFTGMSFYCAFDHWIFKSAITNTLFECMSLDRKNINI